MASSCGLPFFSLLLLSILFAMPSVHAASLNLCPVPVAEGGVKASVTVDPVPGCESRALAIGVGTVRAVRVLSLAQAARIEQQVLLHTSGQGDKLAIGEVVLPEPVQAVSERSAVVLNENLLPQLQAQVFGVEERVRIERDAQGLRLWCDSGTRPAGVLLSAPWNLPRAQLAIELQASGQGEFTLQALDAPRAQRDDALVLGHFTPDGASLPLFHLAPGQLDAQQWRGFVLVCPQGAAQLSLSALRVKPQPAAPIPSRATWVWQAHSWQSQPEQVFAHAERYGMGTLFVSVPVAGERVRDAEQLAHFILAARARGLAVWSVDGDPAMVLEQERDAVRARVRAYARYNREVEPQARLAGAQFDIEHYLLPGYELEPHARDADYGELVQAMRAEAGAALALDFVVPFWWAGKPALLSALGRSADRLTVMDYRTDPREILAFARPFLDWGVVHNKGVRIALEAGPVDSEEQWRFVQAQAGALWLVPFPRHAVLLLLGQDAPNPHGPAFKLEGRRTLDGSATTFHRDPQRLLKLLPTLEADFSAWKSFAGVALHELRD